MPKHPGIEATELRAANGDPVLFGGSMHVYTHGAVRRFIAEIDELLDAKDAEIARLKTRLGESE